MTQAHDRDRWISQDDGRLLSECKADAYRASGPGGQKRNKTSSAVRLRHLPSGLVGGSEESRSQHENKARALRRLRLTLALELREPAGPTWEPPDALRKHRTPSGRLEVSRRNADYPSIVAAVLDVLAACEGGLKECGGAAGSDDRATVQVHRGRWEAAGCGEPHPASGGAAFDDLAALIPFSIREGVTRNACVQGDERCAKQREEAGRTEPPLLKESHQTSRGWVAATSRHHRRQHRRLQRRRLGRRRAAREHPLQGRQRRRRSDHPAGCHRRSRAGSCRTGRN